MKKKLLAGLATGLFLVGMVGMANATAISVFNTGVDDTGAITSGATIDAHYSLVNPAGNTVDAKAAGNGHSAWVNPLYSGSGIAQWITSTGTAGNVAVGTWQYSMKIDLTGMDFNTASIGGRWASDNNAEIVLNGANTGQTTGFDAFNDYTNFLVESGFQAGINTLTFKVLNGANNPNPSGLLVEFEYAETSPVPEPATMLLFGTGLAGLAGVGIRRKKKS